MIVLNKLSKSCGYRSVVINIVLISRSETPIVKSFFNKILDLRSIQLVRPPLPLNQCKIAFNKNSILRIRMLYSFCGEDLCFFGNLV